MEPRRLTQCWADLNEAVTLNPKLGLAVALVIFLACAGEKEAQQARAGVVPGQDVWEAIDAAEARIGGASLRMYCNADGVLVFQAHRPGRSGGYELQTRHGDQECASREDWLKAIKVAASERQCESLQMVVAGFQSFTVGLTPEGRVRTVSDVEYVD